MEAKEQRVLVACQGAEGAYSQMAANRLFGTPDILYMSTFDGVFRAVNSGMCQYGILPVENSDAGKVTDVYELMKAHSFRVEQKVEIAVSHMLLAKENIPLEAVKEVYTHEQAAKQCSNFFGQHPDIQLNICANTAAAARMVAESERKDIGAVASENCIQIYQLTPLAQKIQNSETNMTQFICISRKEEKETAEETEKSAVVL